MKYFEVSAQSGENVKESIQTVVSLSLRQINILDVENKYVLKTEHFKSPKRRCLHRLMKYMDLVSEFVPDFLKDKKKSKKKK